MPLFEAFCRRYPAVSLQITLKSGALDFIEECIDVAIRFTNEPSPQHVARVLGHTQWIFCASPTYLAEQGTPQLPEDLAQRMIALAWWDWDHETLRERIGDFRTLPVAAFLEKYER